MQITLGDWTYTQPMLGPAGWHGQTPLTYLLGGQLARNEEAMFYLDLVIEGQLHAQDLLRAQAEVLR